MAQCCFPCDDAVQNFSRLLSGAFGTLGHADCGAYESNGIEIETSKIHIGRMHEGGKHVPSSMQAIHTICLLENSIMCVLEIISRYNTVRKVR